ncbi:MAG: AraC family transcriptional regulator [Burkholderiaceae bacterium]|jgi:AraC-like DNA-binding protein|nr:AraC family transcriptional regulator [Burkholderiaceae bacterium]
MTGRQTNTMQRESFSVTARFAQALVEAIARQGGQVPEALRPGRTQEGRVDMARQEALWALFVEACADDPLAALRLGTDLQAGHLDIVGMLLLSCDTLGDGLEVLTEYAPIIGDNAHFEVAALADPVQLRYVPGYVLYQQQRVEATLGCVVSLARWMTSGRFRAREVLLAHAARTDAADYEALLGCPVRFGQPVNAVCMDASELNHALVQVSSTLHQHLRVLADGMLASLVQDGVSARVQQWVRAHPRWGKERIAEQLGMSGRHLNRKLALEAISFKGLREALLHDMALQALRDGQKIAAVSEALGFCDENAFSRAFRRWTGQSPAQYQKTERK